MIISIFASVGCQNLGDELILKNEIKLLEKEYGKDTSFIVFTYDKKHPFFTQENVIYEEYFPIGIRKKRNIFKNIKNFFSFLNTILKSDLIVLGGGGIIYDEEKQANKNPLDLWLMRVKYLNFFKKRYIFFRGGINIKNEENLKKVQEIFKKADKIEVRDKYSFELLKNLGIKSSVKKDPVFYDFILSSTEGKKETSKTSLVSIVSSFEFNKNVLNNFDLEGKKVGLALRSGYFVPRSKISNRMEEGIIKEIVNYLLEKKAKVVLLPHSFNEADDLANDFLFLGKFVKAESGSPSLNSLPVPLSTLSPRERGGSKMRLLRDKSLDDKNEKICIKENMQEVYEVYKNREIDFCFAMRLHSIILCQVYGISFVGVSYSTKTDEVLDELGVES